MQQNKIQGPTGTGFHIHIIPYSWKSALINPKIITPFFYPGYGRLSRKKFECSTGDNCVTYINKIISL